VVTWPSPYLRGRLTLAMYRKMGWQDCVADSAEQYVDLAVRLATDRPFRETIREKLQATSHVLFEDLDEVRALERFFRQAVGATPHDGT
jgi:predicted O-linked N-acetylglucosamine transferase (SPINDLY family)